jgi:hypothetical protein
MQQNHANRWGVLKIEKQQMQLLTPYACLNHANILKVQDMNSTHENLHSGRIEQKLFVWLDYGPEFLPCNSFASYSIKSIHLYIHVLRGGY